MGNHFTEASLESARNAIRMIAMSNGVTEAHVREEMMEAMQAGMRDPDPKVRAQWDAIPWSSGKPNVEEFIAWMAEKVRAEKMK